MFWVVGIKNKFKTGTDLFYCPLLLTHTLMPKAYGYANMVFS